ncbi:MAG: hypothetical protein SPF89_06900 [Sphaerochaetaceae bacterium]|nr:hypothetical protein [Spirochaetales bacterium]MDY5499814.1 hypothetical protein [Sphaerochaetaceae bacterium]
MTIGELARAAWFPFSDEPVLKKRWYLPRLESPSVLTPASSPDGKWHLFCQSWIGIQHFFSSNGIVWHALGRLNVIGTDPCVVSEMGMWYLFVARDGKRLCVHASEDLRSWGPSKVVFEGEKGQVVSHPQPCKAGGQWRLYYSLGENELERGRTIPLSVAVASAPAVDGPYRNPQVVIAADADDPAINMGVGPCSVLPCQDGFGLVASSAHWNRSKVASESSLVLFLSQDGIHFGQPTRLLPTPESGWASGFFAGTGCVAKSDERSWYCYYSAFDQSPIPSCSIGLLLGRDTQNPLLMD